MMPQRESFELKITLPLALCTKKTNLLQAMNNLACQRINLATLNESVWHLVTDERPKRLADIVPDDQIGNVILFGGLIVDDHQSGAAVLGQHWKAGGPPDHQRRPDRNKQVAVLCELGGATHRVFRHRLPERDGRCLYRLVANGAVGRTTALFEAPLDPWQVVRLSAADAAGVGGVAVKLDDMFGRKSRYLMQIVDVLGDDGGNLAAPVQRSQRAMTASRPRRGEGRLHRKAPPPCLIPGIPAGDEFIERNRTVAGPQSAGGTEIGNSGFGR